TAPSFSSNTSDIPDTPSLNNGLTASFPGALGDYASSVHDNLTNSDYQTVVARGALILANFSPNPPNANGTINTYSSLTTWASIRDGTSNTTLIGEKHVQVGTFGERSGGDSSIYNGDPNNEAAWRVAGPGNLLAQSPREPYNLQFGSWHTGVCQFVMCDG